MDKNYKNNYTLCFLEKYMKKLPVSVEDEDDAEDLGRLFPREDNEWACKKKYLSLNREPSIKEIDFFM